MAKDELIKQICQNFCRYYKPSKDEELACRGFVILEKLAGKGKAVTFRLPEKTGGPHADMTLIAHVCAECPFFPGDCDFSLKKKGSSPCGGFIVLGRLVEAGLISVDDLKI